MYVLVLEQSIVSFPAVCANSCLLGYNVTDERLEISKRGFWNMTHSNSPKTFRFLDLDSYHNNRLSGSAAALAALHDATKECLVNFDNTRQLPPLTTHHRYPVSLENRPSRPVTGTQRSFQSFCRKAIFGGCKVPCGFKPSRQWRSRFFQNRANRHGCLMTTCRTDQTTTCLSPRIPKSHACRAMKTIWPPQVLQVGSACTVVRKMLHKFAISVWEVASCCHI